MWYDLRVRQPPRIRSPWRLWDEATLRRNVGVYVHIPFCLHRCSYCDFLTYGEKRPAGLTPPAYVEALLGEIARRGQWAWERYGQHSRMVDTVFFGGGTPTYLERQVLAQLIRAVGEHFPVAAAPEITIEANPDTLTREYLDVLADAGVNRLSVGVQATQTRHLRRMERTHRWRDIEPRLAWLADGPIPRYSFDVIYGLPYMTVAEVRETVRRLLQFAPRHISAYELIYEPGTPLYRWHRRFQRQELPERERLAQHRAIGTLLRGYGLYAYEISNYAVPGQESRHNLRYWRGGDYIGLGVGAASRFGADVVNNPRGFEAYSSERGTPVPHASAKHELRDWGRALPVPPADVFMRMRTRAGMQLNGQAPDGEWLRDGLARLRHGRLEVTQRGLLYGDMFHKRLA